MRNDKPVNHVLVLGGGSAGFLAAITLKAKIPSLKVSVYRSKELGIIGVGEGTTIAFPAHLHEYLGISLDEFYKLAEPQWKIGIKFIWGPRPYFDYGFRNQIDLRYPTLPKDVGYYCDDTPWEETGIASAMMHRNRIFMLDPHGRPVVGNDITYHIENEKLVHCFEAVASRLGVEVHDDTVQEVLQDDHGVTGLRMASGPIVSADLYVDCSGFHSVLLKKSMGERFSNFKSTLFCSRAVVGGWKRGDEPIQPYTVAETMQAGWCWRIDHEHHINRGYVYSPEFITDSEAEAEFRAQNPKVEKTRIVRFTTGRYERAWVKNVVAIGNSAGFVEPLEATSLAAICQQCRTLTEALIEVDGVIRPSEQMHFNNRNARSWDCIRRFLAVHYKFNTRIDTPFWVECREKTDLAGAEPIVECYKDLGPTAMFRATLLDPLDQFGMEGYLAMLVGQKVPYHHTRPITQGEWHEWERIRAAMRYEAERAVSVTQALAMIRSPQWTWPRGVYVRC